MTDYKALYDAEVEKNEKWKYWASEVIYWSHSASKDILEAKKLITDTAQPTIGDVRDFGKEIAELKKAEDYEKLQTTIDNKWVEEINSLYITILDLSQEIERLKKLS
jgi:hypothetical protein